MYGINNINQQGREYYPRDAAKSVCAISFGASTGGDEFVVSKETPDIKKGVFDKIRSVFALNTPKKAERTESARVVLPPEQNELYTDTKKFSVYLSDKMNKMLDNLSEDDVRVMTEKICRETGEGEDAVTEVMSELTQFSGWNSLEALEKSFQKSGITSISPFFIDKKHTMSGYAEIGPPMTCDLTINDVFRYAFERKGQINFAKTGVKALFLDDAQLNQLEKVRNENPSIFYDLSDELYSGKTKLFVISGWNAKADGKNVGQSLFGGSCDIKESTTEIINKMKKDGVTLDEALNADTINRAKSLFGSNIEVGIIRNENAAGAKQIAYNVSSPCPSAEQTEKVINILLENCLPKKYPEEQARVLLHKYFDSMVTCHSSRTMTKDWQTKHSEIIEAAKNFGASEEDLVYILPDNTKSYNLSAYQYAKANDIDSSKFVYYSGKGDFPRDLDRKEVNLEGKTLVILDDMVGSGYSMAMNGFYYTEFMAGPGRKCNVIMAPLVSQRVGADFIEDATEMIFKTIKGDGAKKDVLLPGKIVDFDDFLDSAGLPKGKIGFLNRELNMFMKMIGGFGYEKSACCSAFPYMLPDNNSPAAGLLLSPFLRSNNCEANKSNEYYAKFRYTLNKRP